MPPATAARVENATSDEINRRFAAEIDRERYALKALRGDFGRLDAATPDPRHRADTALAATAG